MVDILQTGVLLVAAGCLLFLYQIPWGWMQESSPLLAYSGGTKQENRLIRETITQHIPLYSYAGCDNEAVLSMQSILTEEEIMLAEARDEEQVSFQDKMEEENAQAKLEKNKTEEATAGEKESEEESSSGQSGGDTVSETLSEETVAVDAVSHTAEKPIILDMAQYTDFDKLIQDFYIVDKSTYITAEELQIEKMLNLDLRLEDIKAGKALNASDAPRILIYHTHSQEGYADSVPGDKSMTVVGAGEKLASILKEEYGIPVLHHTGEYDVENRDYAYANVTPVLEQILAENPTIEIIIDLHRDGVAADTRLVTEVNGKPTAQFMFFNGLSRLNSTGEIAYLKNENRSGNLAFSFQLQVKCMEYYPGLTRSIYLKGYRYNMQYKDRSLLVELGAQTNTVEEVYNALPPLAHVISMVLLGEE